MKKRFLFVLPCMLGVLLVVSCSREPIQAPPQNLSTDQDREALETEFELAYLEIVSLTSDGQDVPEALYDSYFRLEQELHPEFYQRPEGAVTALDELSDACPGGVFTIPAGSYPTIITCGQTYTANNDCSMPACRYGRDVVLQLVLESDASMVVRTAGSGFDTFLCMYESSCCGGIGDRVMYNDNNSSLNYGQRLAAGFSRFCQEAGTYWIVLDGAGVSAKGSYCLSIEIVECED
ncbi:MAG: hypothetical protein H6508_03170 [Calditrichaeota bacterium]|nr:hypothetical protein [Calditrichota bacterium]